MDDAINPRNCILYTLPITNIALLLTLRPQIETHDRDTLGKKC